MLENECVEFEKIDLKSRLHPSFVAALLVLVGVAVWRGGVVKLAMGKAASLSLETAGLWLKEYMPGPKQVMHSRKFITYFS